jgi:protein tyrosine phosphatase
MILMVTNLTEGDKLKCSRYFPESADKPLVAGDFTVTLASTQKFTGYVRSELVLKRGQERRTIMHYWSACARGRKQSRGFKNNINSCSGGFGRFTGWPDHGIPVDAAGKIYTQDVLRMLDEARKYLKSLSHPGPIVVHCSAGIGRSGAVIAIDMGMDAVEVAGLLQAVFILF